MARSKGLNLYMCVEKTFYSEKGDWKYHIQKLEPTINKLKQSNIK